MDNIKANYKHGVLKLKMLKTDRVDHETKYIDKPVVFKITGLSFVWI